MMAEPGEFLVWERRDVESGEPYTLWSRDLLISIEIGALPWPDLEGPNFARDTPWEA